MQGDAKAVLMAPGMLRKRLKRARLCLAQRRAGLEGFGGGLAERVQSSTDGSTIPRRVESVLAAEEEVHRLETELEQAMLAAQAVIDRVDNETDAKILYAYYIELKSESRIAGELQYTERHIRRRKKIAIMSLQCPLFMC